MGWIARKSVEHQLRNTTYGVRKLVAAANVITATWDADEEPTTEALVEFKRRKQKISYRPLRGRFDEGPSKGPAVS